MDTILKLLEENGQLTAEQIAVMLGKTEEEELRPRLNNTKTQAS